MEATAAHRRREDAAPRLHRELPRLRSLRLCFYDVPGERSLLAGSYVRPVVIASAPAHFEVRCLEPRCDGRHDLTRDILAGLRASQRQITGHSPCDGYVAGAPCGRTLGYSAEATYAD